MRHESHYNEPAIWTLGCLMVLKNRTDDLEVIDAIVPPGYSPPLHRHDFGAESFYVVEGSARFVRGDEEITLGPGGFVRIPPSVPHSFETLGDTPSRILDILTPAGLWDFFVAAGEPAQELRLPDEVLIPENLPELVSEANGAVLGPPLNRPGLALHR
jgi:mannose-6-phosphate isomerase-like protein (cupin superfamily)